MIPLWNSLKRTIPINSEVNKMFLNESDLIFSRNPPKKYAGSCLDGRDIGSKVVKSADVKFYITANVEVRAKRRFKELKAKNKKITYKEVLKSIKKRDKSDKNRKISPLIKTKEMYFISNSYESISSCFMKIKKIIDRKINN